MVYDAKVIQVMIASPSDVAAERDAVRRVLSEWNDRNAQRRKLVLLPLAWETHTSPSLAGRPQQIINETVLEHADILVGIFWTRLGAPTGVSKSGTLEEIRRHHRQGKPVMLYFSARKADLSKVDMEQYQLVQNTKRWAMQLGLVETFKSPRDLQAKLFVQLPALLDGKYFEVSHDEDSSASTEAPAPVAALHLPSKGYADLGFTLLKYAVNDPNGRLMVHHEIGRGSWVATHDVRIAEAITPQNVTDLFAALKYLVDEEYAEVENVSPEETTYRVKPKAYSACRGH